MTEEKKDSKFLKFAIYFLIASIFVQGYGLLFNEPESSQADLSKAPITIETNDISYSLGSIVELNITNNTNDALRLSYDCPDAPLTVLSTNVEPPVQVNNQPNIDCSKMDDPLLSSFMLPANSTKKLRYQYWSNALFEEIGRYKFIGTFTVDGKRFQTTSNEFTVENRGMLKKLWYFGLYQPIYNLLIGLTSLMPGFSLGLAIITLTLIVRLILLIPSQKSLRAQKAMQSVQPKLDEIRRKYKDNQQKLAEETMKVWKEHKVNPLGSCLPLLIQFPLLLALFYVIKDGAGVNNAHTLYSFQQNFDFSLMETNFLGLLELTKRNIFVLPFIVGVLQFAQMQLSFTKKSDTPVNGMPDLAATQNLMKYFLPAMIAVFTASVPAGVGLYWGTSTLFAIGQQIVINKEGGNNTTVIDAEVIDSKKKLKKKN